MDAPKCKICQLHHYGLCDFTPATKAEPSSVTIPVQPTAKFDKTAYQREYMRRKRAKAKEAK